MPGFLSKYRDQVQATLAEDIGDASTGPGDKLSISGTDQAIQGGLEGLRMGQTLYGQGMRDVGKEALDYSGRVKGLLDKDYAGADVQRQISNQALAKNTAKMGLGATNTFGAQEQMRRQGSMQAAQMNQDYKDKALALYGKNISAKQQGMTSTYFGAKGAGQANTPTNVGSSGGTLGCLALVSVGLMSKETYASEAPFVNKDSLQYIGYALLITPLIPMILKNGWFAKAFSLFAHKYVLHLTGKKKSLTGKIIKNIGESLCSFVGRLC